MVESVDWGKMSGTGNFCEVVKPVTAPISHTEGLFEASWSFVLNKNCLFFLACLLPPSPLPRLTVPCLLQGPCVCHQSRHIIRADNPAAGRNVCPQTRAGNRCFLRFLCATFNIWIQRGSFHDFACRRCFLSRRLWM